MDRGRELALPSSRLPRRIGFDPSEPLLIPHRASSIFPRPNGADISFVCATKEGGIFYCKEDRDGRLIRATEMVLTRLAGHVGIATPHCSVIECDDGTTVFGSLSPNSLAGEFEVQAYLSKPERDEVGGPRPWLSRYEQEIALLMQSFVEPEPAPLKARRGKSSHLATQLKKAFRTQRILALKGEDLSAHRVVTNLELATGLIADFVLKNGAMHVIETVDASSEGSSAMKAVKDIALSALTIEQAKISFGENETEGKLVYNASAETEALATSALLAAEHQGIQLVNWASGDDQRKLVTTITSLAMPVPKKSGRKPAINASAQHRFEIN